MILRPGGMGDLICADIALQELGLESRNFVWLIEKRAESWATYRKLPHLCYDTNSLQTLLQVWGKYPLVINSEQLFGFTQAYALLTRAKGGQLFSFATNRGAYWSKFAVPYDWKNGHETVEFARLFSHALGRSYLEKPRFARKRLFPAECPPIVLLAGLQSPSRRLSLESWETYLKQWHRGRPFLIGASPLDDVLANQLTIRFKGLAQRFTGSFSELCEQIARSEEVFTMDGGSVHIASFFGVPTQAVFTSGQDRKWHPLGEGSGVIKLHDLPCQPCTKFGQVPPCPYHYACCETPQKKVTSPEIQIKSVIANS